MNIKLSKFTAIIQVNYFKLNFVLYLNKNFDIKKLLVLCYNLVLGIPAIHARPYQSINYIILICILFCIYLYNIYIKK